LLENIIAICFVAVNASNLFTINKEKKLYTQYLNAHIVKKLQS